MPDITRRIPRNLGGSDTLLDDAPIVGTVDFADGIVAFGPGILALFVLNKALPARLGWVALLSMAVLWMFGILFLLVKPNHLTLSEWVKNYREFKKRPTHIEKKLATDGGDMVKGVPVSSSKDTRKHTRIEKIHPGSNAVERTDGAMVGMVQFNGLNLDTSTGQEHEMAAQNLANFFNSNLEFDVQFYLPMRQFDPTDQMEMYLDRKEDDDAKENPLLNAYLEDRAAWLQSSGTGSFIREYYLVVAVKPYEVLTDELNKSEFQKNLKHVPGGDALEDFMNGISGGSDSSTTLSENEIKDRQIEELNRRLNELSSGLGQGGENKSEIVDADGLGILLKEYWEGTTVRESEADNFVRRKPFVTGGDTQ